MIKELLSAKKLLSLTVSLVLILSITLLCAPAVFAVEDPPMEYFVANEAQLRTAYAAAAAGDTISLTNNITLTQTLVLDKNIHINCGDRSIAVESEVTISSGSITGTAGLLLNVLEGGELFIQQNASITGGDSVPILVSSDGTLTMSGGNITAGVYAIYISGGTVDLSGGTITLATTDYGILVDSGRLEMSGGTITSTVNPNSCGVWVLDGQAIFTGGSIVANYGVAIVEGEITSSVPAQQLSGIFSQNLTPMVTAFPAAITMLRGQTRTVTLLDADDSFELYDYNTSPALNAEVAGPRSATIRPTQAGSFTLSFLAMIGIEEAFIILNIPVTVTNPTSNNPGTPSGQGEDTPSSQSAQSPSVPSIPETGAGNLLQLLLLSVLCI